MHIAELKILPPTLSRAPLLSSTLNDSGRINISFRLNEKELRTTAPQDTLAIVSSERSWKQW